MEIIDIIGIIIIIELFILIRQNRDFKDKVRTSLKKIYELYWTRTYGGPMSDENSRDLRDQLSDF